jgi:hypothetical protein
MIAPDYESTQCCPWPASLQASHAKPIALSIYFYNFIDSRNLDLRYIVLAMGFYSSMPTKSKMIFFLE